ncbi:MAG: energy-coupling factor transporter ATPase [Clostridia bacterium]|nr:energy-coupling factor transporter ATPase [Clostridia bacterium]
MRIICKDLSFSYEPKKKNTAYALENVSLTIEEGEFFGIIGHTGSGKSTFIQHLNALVPLQSGELLVGEFDLDTKNKQYKKNLKALRSKVGMVFQYPEYQLFAESVFEDVAFGLKNFYPELSLKQIEQKVKYAIELVGLNYYQIKDKSPFDLSGGQKRRVAIAGVLVTDPEILVMDEPVAGLDPVGKKELMDLLHSFKKGNKTVIIVSHDMDEVCENCSRIAIMQGGKVVKVGKPSEVFTELPDENLELPVVARLKNALKTKGVEIDCKLESDDFIEEIVKKYKERNGR